MRYVTIATFEDRYDNAHRYEVGDEYPRPGLNPTKARIAELMGTNNLRKLAVIKPIEEAEPQSEASTEQKPRRRKKANDIS